MSETLCTFSESLVVSIIIVDESLVVLKSATKSEAMDTLSL